MVPRVTSLLVVLGGFTGLSLLGAALAWVKLAYDHEGSSEHPTIPVNRFRAAAALTSGSLALLGVWLIYLALLTVSWGE
jgi:multisubunit Na+/H+ antiporter MnhB subunit